MNVHRALELCNRTELNVGHVSQIVEGVGSIGHNVLIALVVNLCYQGPVSPAMVPASNATSLPLTAPPVQLVLLCRATPALAVYYHA